VLGLATAAPHSLHAEFHAFNTFFPAQIAIDQVRSELSFDGARLAIVETSRSGRLSLSSKYFKSTRLVKAKADITVGNHIS
jgi:hypothetical protein